MHVKIKSTIFLLALTICTQAHAAQLLELRNHQDKILQSFIAHPQLKNSSVTIKEISRFTDFKHMTHIRVQEFYQSYPVWNARAVIHMPYANTVNHSFADILFQPQAQKSMNGELYQKLDADLNKAPSVAFSKQQADRALQFAIDKYKEKITDYAKQINNAKSQL